MKKIIFAVAFVLVGYELCFGFGQLGTVGRNSQQQNRLNYPQTPQIRGSWNSNPQQDVYRAMEMYNRNFRDDEPREYEIRRKSRDRWEIRPKY